MLLRSAAYSFANPLDLLRIFYLFGLIFSSSILWKGSKRLGKFQFPRFEQHESMMPFIPSRVWYQTTTQANTSLLFTRWTWLCSLRKIFICLLNRFTFDSLNDFIFGIVLNSVCIFNCKLSQILLCIVFFCDFSLNFYCFIFRFMQWAFLSSKF